jgi:hypothetical protein
MTTPIYLSGAPVAITVNLPLWAGVPVTLTAISRVVTNEAGSTISGDTVVSLPTGLETFVVVPVSGTLNTLSAGSTDALRQVTTTIVSPVGTFTDTQSYIVRSTAPLVRMSNSFITLPETILVRHAMTKLNGWDAATEDQQIAALISAHRNMTQLRYRFPIGENFQSRIVDFYGMSVDNVFGRIFVVLSDIMFYNETDYAGFPEDFQQALKRAQMAEADNLLGGDPIGAKRAVGIVSEDIGESRMKFQNIPEIQSPICRVAMNILRGYIVNAVLVGRS